MTGLFNDRRFSEIVRTLNGESRLGLEAAALRVMDFNSLANIDLTQQSYPITGAPTQDDYNRLVDDVQRIFEALTGAKYAIQARANGESQ